MTTSGRLLDRFLRYVALASACQTDPDSGSTLAAQVAQAKVLRDIFETRPAPAPLPRSRNDMTALAAKEVLPAAEEPLLIEQHPS